MKLIIKKEIMQKVFSIFAQNLAYYNEGTIEGGWIDLPQSPEVIDRYLKKVVKVDDEHEEYEIADVDNLPFPYESVQWSSVEDINNLAVIFSTLDENQKEAILAHLVYEGEEHYGIDELINICLQANDITYYKYNFEGIERCENCSPEVKMGYTMAEETGLYNELEKLGAINYFDFEKYGESYEYDYELLENGYLMQGEYNLDLNLYSKQEIEQKVNEILNQKLQERELEEIEI